MTILIAITEFLLGVGVGWGAAMLTVALRRRRADSEITKTEFHPRAERNPGGFD